MYESPITLIATEVQMKMENDTLQAVQRYGIDVDKDELMKALNYDRGQYDKGFKDGVLHGERLYAPKIAEWKLPPNSMGERYCSNCYTLVDYRSQGKYCLYCGAKMTQYQTPDGFKPISESEPIRYMKGDSDNV